MEKDGFNRSIHNIENTPFRTKFDGDLDELEGHLRHRLHLRYRTTAPPGTVSLRQFCHYHGRERSTTWTSW